MPQQSTIAKRRGCATPHALPRDFSVREATNRGDYALVVYIRVLVFVIEQRIPISDEIDAHEVDATHYLGCYQGRPTTTCRYRIEQAGKVARIERVATLREFRQSGHATSLLRSVIGDIAAKTKCERIVLSAQTSAVPFYEKLGFLTSGKQFTLDGIAHRKMWMKTK